MIPKMARQFQTPSSSPSSSMLYVLPRSNRLAIRNLNPILHLTDRNRLSSSFVASKDSSIPEKAVEARLLCNNTTDRRAEHDGTWRPGNFYRFEFGMALCLKDEHYSCMGKREDQHEMMIKTTRIQFIGTLCMGYSLA